MKKILTLTTVVLGILAMVSCDSFMGAASSKEVKWMSLDKVIKKKASKKKVFIDVYTNWCGWCKRMDKTTFQDPRLVKYINENFHSVKFNAEIKKDIEFKGKVYKFANTGRRGRHELATMFMQENDKVGYPTLVFLDEELNIIQAVPGYRNTEEFEKIITYFAEGHYQTTPWLDYEANYKPMTMK